MLAKKVQSTLDAKCKFLEHSFSDCSICKEFSLTFLRPSEALHVAELQHRGHSDPKYGQMCIIWQHHRLGWQLLFEVAAPSRVLCQGRMEWVLLKIWTSRDLLLLSSFKNIRQNFLHFCQ